MIKYDNSSPTYIFQFEGSNIPKATCFALPSVCLAVACHFFIEEYSEREQTLEKLLTNFNFGASWSASVIVLSVLLSLRTTKAYDRFWEGITLVQLMRAEWFETASNLIAFSHTAIKKSQDPTIVSNTRRFQFTLVRLMSLMQGKALRAIRDDQEEFEVLDINSLDAKSLRYLKKCETNGMDTVEIVLHWLQVLVTDAHIDGCIPVPPPILTRVFQTLSRGMVNYHNARKLADVPFPYPLSQMVVLLLIFQSVMTPLILATTFRDPVYSGFLTFLPMLGMWCITFTATELEQPFGNDANDLPLSDIQEHYNQSLMMLLDTETFSAPTLAQVTQLTVKELRKQHTVNTENAASRTDLSRWQRFSRMGSALSSSRLSTGSHMEASLALSNADGDEGTPKGSGVTRTESIPEGDELHELLEISTAQFPLSYSREFSGSINNSYQITPESEEDMLPKKNSSQKILEPFESMDEKEKQSIKEELESCTRESTGASENMEQGRRSMGITTCNVPLQGIEFPNEDFSTPQDDATTNVTGHQAKGNRHRSRVSLNTRGIIRLGEPSISASLEDQALEKFHETLPKLLEEPKNLIGRSSPHPKCGDHAKSIPAPKAPGSPSNPFVDALRATAVRNGNQDS